MSEPITSDDFLKRGLDWLEKKQFEKCIIDFDKAIELDPKNASAYGERGIIKSRYLSDHIGAIKDFTKEIEIDSPNAYAHLDRGNAYAELGDHNQAINDYSKALEIDPNLSNAYKYRGLSKELENDIEGALKDWHEASKLGDIDSEDWINEVQKRQISEDKEENLNDWRFASRSGDQDANDWGNEAKIKRIKEYTNDEFAIMTNQEIKEILKNEIPFIKNSDPRKAENLRNIIYQIENGIYKNPYRKNKNRSKSLKYFRNPEEKENTLQGKVFSFLFFLWILNTILANFIGTGGTSVKETWEGWYIPGLSEITPMFIQEYTILGGGDFRLASQAEVWRINRRVRKFREGYKNFTGSDLQKDLNDWRKDYNEWRKSIKELQNN